MENHIKYADDTRLAFMKLSEDAKAPQRGSINAAGFDLFSAKTVLVPSQDRVLPSRRSESRD